MIKKCRLSDIPGDARFRQAGRRISDIEEFIASNDDACEVILTPGEKAKNVQVCFITAIGRRQYYKDIVQCIVRCNRVFLIRKEEKRIKEDNDA